eukprot:1176820-Prorocentrum_minimum.AAC.2
MTYTNIPAVIEKGMEQLKQEIAELSGPVVRTENDLQELRTTLSLVLESLHDVKVALLGVKLPCHVRDSGAQTNLSDDDDADISLLPLPACDNARCAATGNLRAEEATVATITTTTRLTTNTVSKKTAERGTTSMSIRPYLVQQQQQQQQLQEAPAPSHRKRNATSSATAQCQGTASGIGKQLQSPHPLKCARVDASEAGAKALFKAEDDDTVTCLLTNTSASSFLNSTSSTPTKARGDSSLKDGNYSETNKIRRMISRKINSFHRRKPRGQTSSLRPLEKAAASSTAHAWQQGHTPVTCAYLSLHLATGAAVSCDLRSLLILVAAPASKDLSAKLIVIENKQPGSNKSKKISQHGATHAHIQPVGGRKGAKCASTNAQDPKTQFRVNNGNKANRCFQSGPVNRPLVNRRPVGFNS